MSNGARSVILLMVLAASAAAQPSSLSLSGAAGVPGSTVTVSVSLSPGGTAPASVQWDLTYSTSDINPVAGTFYTTGAAASAAGKLADCGTISTGHVRCLVLGTNTTAIGSGVVATLAFQIATGTTDTSAPLSVSAPAASDGNGNPLSITGTGGTVTINYPVVAVLSSLNCSPASVTPPASSICTAGLSGIASSPVPVNLGSDTSAASVPASVSISTGQSSTTFTVSTSAVSTSTTAHISAMSGSSSVTFPLTLMPAGVGSVPGDFNGDGHPDLLWQYSSTGQVAIWYMGGAQGNNYQSWAWLSAGNMVGWTLAGAADFNADGHPDLIWQNSSTGQVAVWYMGGAQGSTTESEDWLNASTMTGWTLIAAADLNGDGHPDLIWQNNSTSQVLVWYMGGSQGNTYQSSAWLNAGALPGWSVVAVTDFNGDGHPDLVWQNTSTRQTAIWYMGGAQGATYQSWAWLDPVAQTGWSVVGAVDLNGDGHPDLIWQSDTTQQVAVWYMGGAQGNTYQSWGWLSVGVETGWTAIARFN
jgi:FG-GAP-like repeat/Cohesin domain/FG-GAP repeat